MTKPSNSIGCKRLVENLIELLPFPIYWKDRQSRYVGCNSSFAKYAGWNTPGEVAGKTDFDMRWQEAADVHRAEDQFLIKNCAQKNARVEPEVAPGGSIAWMRTAKIPLRDHRQRVIGVLGFYYDVTEPANAIKTETAIARALAVLSTDSGPPLVSSQNEGSLLSGIFRILVEESGYLMSCIELQRQRPDHCAFCLRKRRRRQQREMSPIPGRWSLGGNAFERRERRSKYRGPEDGCRPKALRGACGHLSLGCELQFRHAKEVMGHYRQRHVEDLVMMRTAQLARAKGEAERANSAKSRFLATASHDLQQPLTAVKLYAGVLKSKLGTEAQPMLTSIEACVESLSDLLSKLLDLSKLEAGVVAPSEHNFALDDMLAKMFATFAPVAQAKGIKLRHRVTGLTGCSDSVLFQRIVGNLLDNAIHYTMRGGVLIACRYHQGRRWIEVWDTGIGIPEDKIGEIFEEFMQLGNEARTRGSGLGLAIARRTAALLGLEMRVSSRPNRGSMFAIEFPVGDCGRGV